MHGSRGCLGCCTKPAPVIAVDEPSKGLRIQGQAVKKPSISEDFWSTSTCEMDNSAVQSQRSISSISTSNQTLDPHGGSSSSSNPPEFVNHGKFYFISCSNYHTYFTKNYSRDVHLWHHFVVRQRLRSNQWLETWNGCNTGHVSCPGLLLWNQARQQWAGHKRPENRTQQIREPRLSLNATYDNLLGTNKPFPQQVPLAEMVDFLVDIWEQEGMFD